MPTIPIYNRQLIETPAPIDSGKGQIAASIVDLANTGAKVYEQRDLQQDKIKSNQLASQFQLELIDDWDNLKKERQNNPANLAEDFDQNLQKKRDNFLSNPKINSNVKQNLGQFIDKQRVSFKQKALAEQDDLMLHNFGAQIEQTTQNNNLMAYRFGQKLDIKALSSVNGMIQRNLDAGKDLVTPDVYTKMRLTQTQNAYSNFFDGSLENHPEATLKLINSGKYDQQLGADNLQKIRGNATQIINEKKKEAEKQYKVYETAQKTINTMNGLDIMTNTDPDDVKSVNAYWDVLKKEGKIDNNFSNNINQAGTIFNKTGIIPSEVKYNIAAQLQNGSASDKIQAIGFIDNLNQKNPIAYKELPAQTQAIYTSMSSYIAAGADPDTANKWTMQNLKENTHQKDVRQKQYRDYLKDNSDSVESNLADSFDHNLIGFNPQINDDIKNDFYQNFENFYINQGLNEDQAFDASIKNVKTKYSISELSGKSVVTKYSPEAYYGNIPGSDINPTKWIKSDWKGFVEKKTESLLPDNFNKDLVLEPTPFSENTSQPVYYVKKRSGTNLDYLTDKNGNVMLYQPNFRRYVESELSKPKELTSAQKDEKAKTQLASGAEKFNKQIIEPTLNALVKEAY